jgi:CheY-like chemotaxis protein
MSVQTFRQLVLQTGVPRPESARILIVDDQPSVRRFVGRILNGAGYTTVSASDGPEALKIIETSGPVNLLVTDLATSAATAWPAVTDVAHLSDESRRHADLDRFLGAV